jgi:hypothetical protein
VHGALKSFPVAQLTAANRRTVIRDSVKEIFDGKSLEINRGLFDIYFNNCNSGVTAVFGDRDDETVQRYRQNVARMAAAKAARVTAGLDRLRADRDGVVRKWKEYRPLADELVKTYSRYQVTEYNAIVNRCRTAEQFERFRKEAHIFPNIKWLLTVSAIPRELHLALVDLVLPIDHPFWVENQPGNLWNCKCDWIQTRDAAAADVPKSVKPDTGLEGNPAGTGEIFTGAHPYLDGTEPHIPDNGLLLAPDSVGYLKRRYEGVDFLVHFNAQKEFESVGEEHISALIGLGFKDFRFLPVVKPAETDLRKRYFGKYLDSKKSADILDSDGTYIELKTTFNAGRKTRRNIIANIGDGAKKADAVLMVLKKSFPETALKQIAQSQFALYNNLKRVIFIYENQSFDYTR